MDSAATAPEEYLASLPDDRRDALARVRDVVNEHLPDAWYVSPNAHLCTIKDFVDLCRVVDARVERAVAFNSWGRQLGTWIPLTAHNMLGEKAVFMLARK